MIIENLKVVVQLSAPLVKESIDVFSIQCTDSNVSAVKYCLLIGHGDILIRCMLVNVLKDRLEIGCLARGQVDYCSPFCAFDMLCYRNNQAGVRFRAGFCKDKPSRNFSIPT